MKEYVVENEFINNKIQKMVLNMVEVIISSKGTYFNYSLILIKKFNIFKTKNIWEKYIKSMFDVNFMKTDFFAEGVINIRNKLYVHEQNYFICVIENEFDENEF